jgi:predicted aldo/keto reductase-like oxidoreductase
MTIFDNYFTIGLGTSRFPISGPNDTAGIDKSIELVCHALERGVNYIDTSYIYSAGMAQTVLKEAFVRTGKQVGVTVKVMYDMDKTADDARRRVELQLNAMGIDKAAFFTCWTVLSFTEFEKITQKGGVYEGAVKLRDEGLIERICFSAHASPEDIVKIIESGAFEGVTVSYSLLNAAHMQSVLDAAQRHNVGVAVMNPLGGGMIAQNADYFSFACGGDDSSAVHAALRFAKAHPAVKIVLAGVNTIEEFDDSLDAMTMRGGEPDDNRLSRVMRSVSDLKGFCTGCKYCDGCPKGIPTPLIMQKRNNLLFKTGEAWNRTDPRLSIIAAAALPLP